MKFLRVVYYINIFLYRERDVEHGSPSRVLTSNTREKIPGADGFVRRPLYLFLHPEYSINFQNLKTQLLMRASLRFDIY